MLVGRSCTVSVWCDMCLSGRSPLGFETGFRMNKAIEEFGKNESGKGSQDRIQGWVQFYIQTSHSQVLACVAWTCLVEVFFHALFFKAISFFFFAPLRHFLKFQIDTIYFHQLSKKELLYHN